MDQVGIDRLLRRRLYLQRYVTHLFNDTVRLTSEGDRQLVAAINEFAMEANESDMIALSVRNPSNRRARIFVSDLQRIIRAQYLATSEHLLAELEQVPAAEAAVVTRALDERHTPSMRGEWARPIGGQLPREIITVMFARYLARVLAQVTQTAGTQPSNLARVIRGNRSENYRDGVLFWRNARLLRPNVDVLVNGVAENAARATYTAHKVEQLHWLATLDYRVCLSCRAAEAGSPYPITRAPRPPMHPNCRCLTIPADPGITTERPFVRDDRSVKDIPKAQRGRKIGTTTDTIEQFFNRMSDADREAYMGKRRAQMWKSGAVTNVRELVDNRTFRPLRLDELPG